MLLLVSVFSVVIMMKCWLILKNVCSVLCVFEWLKLLVLSDMKW